MFAKLVSRNDDLRRIVERGFAAAFDDTNHLVIRDVPYLNDRGELAWGAIVTKLVFVDETAVTQHDHQVFFAGGAPHGLDGSPIPNLGGGPATVTLSPESQDVVVQRSFSNKPKKSGWFADFFEKIESYVSIISGPAIEKFGASPFTFRVTEASGTTSVFKFRDTMTSRAEITDLAGRFDNEVLAIIGLGGTGGYLLDLAVRTPVAEIRGFDADKFYVHNAYRAPGRLLAKELGRPKARVHRARYASFRRGLKLSEKYVDASSASALKGVTFAFVCVDKGSARAEIWDLLIRLGIPFIDVGMGLRRKGNGPLGGMIRLTYVETGDPKGLRAKALAEMADHPDHLYRTNVQIGELNSLNACLALIRYKQIRGFYAESEPYYHFLMSLSDLRSVGETDDDLQA